MKRFVLVALAVLALVAVLSPFGYYYLKSLRSGQHLQEAIALKGEGQDAEALSLLQSAYNLDPDDPEILVLLGPYGADVEHPKSLDWWMEAADSGLLEGDELLEMVEYGNQMGRGEAVYPYVHHLLSNDPDNLRAKVQKLLYLQRSRQDFETFALARELIRAGSWDPVVVSAYTFLAFNLPHATRDDREEALRMLVRHSEDPGELGILCLRSLLDFWGQLDAADRERVTERLERHPQTRFSDGLKLLSRQRQGGLEKEAVLERARERFAKEQAQAEDGGPAALQELVVWLNQEGFSEEALDLLEAAPTDTDATLFMARQVALIKTGRSEEAFQENLLENPLPEGRKLVLRAMALDRMGEAERVEETLQLAIQVYDPEEVTFLETVLRQAGRRDLLVRMFEGLESTIGNPLPARLKLMEYYYQAGDESGLSRIVRLVSPRELQGFPVQQISLLYFRLLFQVETGQALQRAEARVAEYPNIVDFRVLLAFAYAFTGDPSAARGMLENIDETLLSDQIHLRICAAYAHFVAGNAARAREHLEGIDPDILLRQEQILFRAIMTGPEVTLHPAMRHGRSG